MVRLLLEAGADARFQLRLNGAPCAVDLAQLSGRLIFYLITSFYIILFKFNLKQSSLFWSRL